MWGYTYKHGDRPLDGFTIQRAAGRGGFGEVYYALSDGGREVALKVVTGFAQVELRGISQCMNLKSPYLVTIFDVKYNHEGRPFVVMEFVSGPSLRQMLDESPAGLGLQKTAFFLREIGKGLTYLHDCGIVHRDLKPANIFFENGYVKIGDYGLSKAISSSPDSGQTVTVGTVHYMAPEIGAGKYDRSIDIYAMGCVLYELLTGTVPFVGASPTEVLMKHLSSEPDVAGLPEPFASVIRKAMAKKPEDRYQSVQEMVEAVFGAEHVRQSVSVFSPADLSVAAAKAAQRVGVGAGSKATPPPVQPRVQAAGGAEERQTGASAQAGAVGGSNARQQTDAWGRLASILDDAQQRATENIRQFGSKMDEAADAADSLTTRQRRLLAGSLLVMAVLVSAAAFGNQKSAHPAILAVFCLLCVTGATMGIMYAGRNFLFKLEKESTFHKRLIGGMCALLPMAVLGGGMALGMSSLGPLLLALAGTFFVVDVSEWLRVDRQQRVVVARLVTSAVAALILGSVFDSAFTMVGVVCVAGVSAAVQLLTPWDRAASEVRAEAEKKRVTDREEQWERESEEERKAKRGGVGVAAEQQDARVREDAGLREEATERAGGAKDGGGETAGSGKQQNQFVFDLHIGTKKARDAELRRMRGTYWNIPMPSGLKVTFVTLMGIFIALTGLCFSGMVDTGSDRYPAPFVKMNRAQVVTSTTATVTTDGGKQVRTTTSTQTQQAPDEPAVVVSGTASGSQNIAIAEGAPAWARHLAEQIKAQAQSAARGMEAAAARAGGTPTSGTGPAGGEAIAITQKSAKELANADAKARIEQRREWAGSYGGLVAAFGVMAVCCFRRWREDFYFGAWPSLFRPVLLYAGIAVILGVAVGYDVLRDRTESGKVVAASIAVMPFLLPAMLLSGLRKWEEVVEPEEVSSVYNRDLAMGLTALWLLGVGGIHRFYTGRPWTGLIWLLTVGLFGIGQLIDLILLASNQFRDGQGRLLMPRGMTPPRMRQRARRPSAEEVAMAPERSADDDQLGRFAQTVSAGVTAAAQSIDSAMRGAFGSKPEAVKAKSSLGISLGSDWGRRLRRTVSASVASILLFVAVVLTLALAVDLPGAVEAKVGPLEDLQVPATIQAIENWPYVARKLGRIGLAVTLMGAALLTMVNRIGTDAKHLYRGLAGIGFMGGFALAATFVVPAEAIWKSLAQDGSARNVGLVIGRFIGDSSIEAVVVAGVMLVASALMLAWPRGQSTVRKDAMPEGAVPPTGGRVPPPTL